MYCSQACATASACAGALKTLGANKDLALPIKLFELSDVVLLAPDKEVGSTNQRQLVAVHCSKESGFEIIHGLLNRVMEVLGMPLKQGEVTCEAAQHAIPSLFTVLQLCVVTVDSHQLPTSIPNLSLALRP